MEEGRLATEQEEGFEHKTIPVFSGACVEYCLHMYLMISSSPMSTNVNVDRNPNESASSVLRRFTKRTQESGVLNRVRSIRYNERVLSFYKNKMSTLEKLEKAAVRERLAKLGKLPVRTKKR